MEHAIPRHVWTIGMTRIHRNDHPQHRRRQQGLFKLINFDGVQNPKFSRVNDPREISSGLTIYQSFRIFKEIHTKDSLFEGIL